MPTQGEHLKQAEHNETLYAYLDSMSPTYTDWQVTCLFYAALHYVDAYLDTQGIPRPKGHPIRNSRVLQHLSGIYDDYYELYERSRDARYDLIGFSAEDVANLRAQRFARIRTHIRTSLGLPL